MPGELARVLLAACLEAHQAGLAAGPSGSRAYSENVLAALLDRLAAVWQQPADPDEVLRLAEAAFYQILIDDLTRA